MIKKVTLKDFQAHKNLVVDCAGFTTLTGGSNGGKSAVLRAIIGLVRNDSATDYVRQGQKHLEVELEFDDGHKVKWLKGTGLNKYVLTEPDGKETEFDKVGADVPEEVRKVLRLGPVAVKGSEKEYVNFHRQLEAPFLISRTPGSVAKLFGELTSASRLYTAVGEGNKKARRTKSLRSTRKGDLRDIEKSFDDFSGLDENKADLEKAKLLVQSAEKVKAMASGIEALVEEVDALSTEINTLQESLNRIKGAADLDISSLVIKMERAESLSDAFSSYDKVNRMSSTLEVSISSLGPAEGVDLTALMQKVVRLHKLSDVERDLSELKDEEGTLKESIEGAVEELESVELEVTEVLSSIESCPECGQELGEGGLEHLLSKRGAHAKV